MKPSQLYSGWRLPVLIMGAMVLAAIFLWDFSRHLQNYLLIDTSSDKSSFSNSLYVLFGQFIIPWIIGSGALLVLGILLKVTYTKEQNYQRLELAIASTTDILFVTNMTGRIEFINDAFTHITGWTRKQALGRTPNILKSGLMSPAFYDQIWATLRQGNAWSGRVINRRKTPVTTDRKLHLPIFGEAITSQEADYLYWAEQTITTMCDEQGRATAYVAMQRDITRQVLDEQQRQQEKSYTQLLATMGPILQKQYPLLKRLSEVLDQMLALNEFKLENRGGIFLYAPDSKQLELTLTCGSFDAEFWKKERGDSLSQYLSAKADQDGDIYISDPCCDSKALAVGVPSHAHLIVPLIHRGDRLGVLFLYSQPCFEVDPTRIAIFKEIGERLSLAIANDRLHQEISDSVLHQKRILDVAATAIFVVDDHRKVTEVNDEFCRITGYSRNEIIGSHCSVLRNEDSASAEYKSKIDRQSQSPIFRQRSIILAKDKRELAVIKNTQPCYGQDYKPIGWIESFVDVTELDQACSKAQQASEFKSQFVANMSHEIRTPMTAIMGYSQLLLEEAGGHPTCHDYIQTIQRNGEHLLALINDILDISKIEAGHLDVETLTCSPVKIVAEVVSMMRHQTLEKGLNFEVNYMGSIPQTIQTDPTRLRQILNNLVGNAIKFTQKGTVRIDVRFEEPQSLLRFDVIDTGIGITEQQMTRLFQAFSQADTSTTRKFGGTGLGLSISRSLARHLGGDVVATSKPDEGSCFSVTIATRSLKGVAMLEQPCEIHEKPSPKNSSVFSSKGLKGMRVLVAEDGPDNQRLVDILLRRAGAEVVIVENGQLAVNLVTQSKTAVFDVILMDMQMPVLDGYDATRQLRCQGYRKPILAMTAHTMVEDRRKCLDAGCDGHVSKPINAKKLIEVVKSYGGSDFPAALAS
ncbi:MAG: response regulator [Phycisphaeraceae bacterium]|nr:response regulator [Phycisphaeraceae bacterium]